MPLSPLFVYEKPDKVTQMRYLTFLLPLCLMACGVQPPKLDGPLPPLIKQLSCLPKEAALISAHRGTSRGSSYAENSIEALKYLLDRGYLMSEIDVSRLKDNTHILYHDGVWEKGSTGKGVVAATSWAQASEFILKDTQSRYTSQRIPKLEDYLSEIKGRAYLEIDFKSSANYEYVIELIREFEMSKYVILISYNAGQAKKLSRLAPEMLISIPTQRSRDALGYPEGQAMAWVSKAITDTKLIQRLNEKNILILGKVGHQWSEIKARNADILVTDYAIEHRPITGLTRKNQKAYINCLGS